MKRDPECTRCRLHLGAKTVCIMGEGKKKPDMMLVGEAPGGTEDQEGRPFIGKAGNLLRASLKELGVENYFVTNVARCRPPGNRAPKAEEIRACRPYLEWEILQRKPRIIVFLGATAATWAGFKGAISLLRLKKGLRFELEGKTFPCLVTFHPAAVLRSPFYLDPLLYDLDRARRMDLDDSGPRVAGMKKFPSQDIVALDIETTGLDPFYDTVRCVAVSGEPRRAFSTANLERVLDKLDGRTIVGHNIKFDLLWTSIKQGWLPEKIKDTQVAAHLLDENQRRFGLENCLVLYTPYGEHKRWLEGQDWKDVEQSFLEKYCRYDAASEMYLWKTLKKKLRKEKLDTLFDQMMEVELAIVDIEANGITVDPAALKKMTRSFDLRRARYKARLAELTGISSEDLSWDSPKQVSDYLFNVLKLPVLSVTDAGHASVKADVLKELKVKLRRNGSDTGFRILDALENYRATQKTINTYLKKFPTYVSKDGRIHPSFNMTGTVTGRLSCSNPNLQNVPPEVRSLFVSRFVGGVIIKADHSQLELRVAADLTGDEGLVQAFREGKDLHSLSAAAIFHVKPSAVTKAQRAVAKTVNFAMFYGAGASKVGKLTGTNLHQAAKILQSWFLQFPKVKKWMRTIEEEMKEKGWVSNPLGRRRRLPLGQTLSPREYEHVLRQAINFPVQSYASDITLFHLKEIREQLRGRGLLVATVHDEIVLDVPRECVQDVVTLVRGVMKKPPLPMKVPLEPTVSVGRNWGEVKEVR